METPYTLKDGTEVLIRELREDDVERSLAFFCTLPPEDRLYLRNDVTRRDVVERRIASMKDNRIRRIVAVVGDAIVADGSLESEGSHWKAHVAEMRILVAQAFRRKHLGVIMARELYLIAASKRVEEVVAKFMETQAEAREIVTRLGFHEQAVLSGYVKDIEGRRHDLIIMRCPLQELMQEMEDHYTEPDFQRGQQM
jgi:ribosomal protein S18 acetylase RimI-like enzyme